MAVKKKGSTDKKTRNGAAMAFVKNGETKKKKKNAKRK